MDMTVRRWWGRGWRGDYSSFWAAAAVASSSSGGSASRVEYVGGRANEYVWSQIDEKLRCRWM